MYEHYSRVATRLDVMARVQGPAAAAWNLEHTLRQTSPQTPLDARAVLPGPEEPPVRRNLEGLELQTSKVRTNVSSLVLARAAHGEFWQRKAPLAHATRRHPADERRTVCGRLHVPGEALRLPICAAPLVQVDVEGAVLVPRIARVPEIQDLGRPQLGKDGQEHRDLARAHARPPHHFDRGLAIPRKLRSRDVHGRLPEHPHATDASPPGVALAKHPQSFEAGLNVPHPGSPFQLFVAALPLGVLSANASAQI
mmetsp:Transcript_16758/g.47937  ORF Transcript_16758/g.47937 Transcript_16758/m.47937 type:complete len:253 (-) Transcript_16758:166-924(-)